MNISEANAMDKDKSGIKTPTVKCLKYYYSDFPMYQTHESNHKLI